MAVIHPLDSSDSIAKIKVLFVTDDIRFPTGVGIQARKLLTGLLKTGYYDIVAIGGSIVPQSPQPLMIEGVKTYPVSNGYGDARTLKAVLNAERPEIVVLFSDPRFFEYAFSIDNEIRSMSKLVLYHTWDNKPYPAYNDNWYKACDKVATISKFSHHLLQSGGTDNVFLPHGFDPNEFYPLPEEVIAREKELLLQQAGLRDMKHIIFWNNNNITRKRPGDVIEIVKRFIAQASGDLKRTVLLMNTVSHSREGTDLMHLIHDRYNHSVNVIQNLTRITSERLNVFYNISDLTLNIAYNEGFGLCVGESLLAGTPVVCTATGGMVEQMTNGIDIFGRLIKPDVQTLFGTPGMPYILQDYVSYSTALSGIDKVLKNLPNYKRLALKGRKYIMDEYNTLGTVRKWDNFLRWLHLEESKFVRYTLKAI
jgi:glycosyltransferase involved in cell wall biosynthesis